MRRIAGVLAAVFIIACGSDAPKPLSEPGEKLYDLRGVIESRDSGDNTIRIRHEAIANFMEAMTMDFSVRGAEARELPADGTRVTARLHVTDRAYWLTDLKVQP